MTVTLSVPSLQPVSAEVWRIERSCALDAANASGDALIRAATPDPLDPPHQGLAGARACAALATERADSRDWPGMAAAARAGLDALGSQYAPAGTKDDTAEKRDAAEERLANGFAEDGARNLLRVLQSRIALYTKRYAADLAEAP
jgi:hypothetical protein